MNSNDDTHPGRAYCDQPHPGEDIEADRWCRDYHRPVGPRVTFTFAVSTSDPYSTARPLHYVRAATEDDAVAEARDRHGHATGVPTVDVSAVSHGDMSTSPEWTTP